ncbi:MAG: M13 family metallopeptidase [Acidimicrobiales bacterium]
MTDPTAPVRPQDDLFRHVNATWLATTSIPPDRSRYGSFHELADAAEIAARAILEECREATPGTEARQIGDLYASFLDEECVEARGAEPIAATLAEVAAVSSLGELVALLGRLERTGLGGFYGAFVDQDPGDPERYRVLLEQGGISLPDESYYREEHFASVRAAFVAHVARSLALAGWDEVDVRAARVLELETALAAGHWDQVASRDAVKTYNLTAFDALVDVVGPHLATWREALGAPAVAFDEVVVRQPSFAETLAAQLVEDQLPAWRDWLAWRVVRAASPYLSAAFVEAHFDFYGRTLTGQPEQRARWKRGVALVEGTLGEALGRLYVERHFAPAAKARMDQLVANLLEAYRRSIAELAWMSPATRQRALAKLATFNPKIGYPVRWRDYASVAIDAGDLIGNVRRATAFEVERQLGKIGRPVDRDEWFMLPQTVNAYYNPGMNEIVFPAAILQPPFFDQHGDDAANYGAIGAVIGHEIGHGFDDQGSRYDGAGRLADWWEAADRVAFEERTAALIGQYDALVPEGSVNHVNGALTIGENIGDLGGLGIAWQAYQVSLGGAADPVIDGRTGAERFLFAWARAWRSLSRPEETERLLAIDPHSPPEFRCNQVARNLEVFYQAFGAVPGDAMYLAPEGRVTIW